MPALCGLQGEREFDAWEREEGGGVFLSFEEEWDESAVGHVGRNILGVVRE